MNEEVKKKWVEALRSGRYKQGFYTLRKKRVNADGKLGDENVYCCLDVLLDVCGNGRVGGLRSGRRTDE